MLPAPLGLQATATRAILPKAPVILCTMNSNDAFKFDPEGLRPPEYVCEPDPRTTAFVTWDASGTFRTFEVRDYHALVSQLKLSGSVPERVAIQFETVKNLYVYSWFVYGFFPVAEHQALACLELALRTRYEPNRKRS